MENKYEKEEIEKIKQNLTIEQVFSLVEELGGEPRMANGYFISQTICHNHAGEGSHKLYYYDNTKLFICYTDCGDRFDIFDLICRHMNTIGQLRQYYSKDGELKEREWEIFDAIEFVLLYFNISSQNKDFSKNNGFNQDWDYLNKLDKNIEKLNNKKRVEMKIYDKNILNFLPQPKIELWIKEGITQEVMNNRNIHFDYKNYGVVIPHYNIDGELVGIRERTLIKENEKNGKYKPAIFNGKIYNHPLGFNLYNLNNSKDNIKKIEKAIVWEGEKSSLLFASYFGIENDISVATCGFNILNYQVELLISCGAKEIIIGFDKQFQEEGDEDWQKLIKKLTNIHNKYGAYVQISYLFDKNNLLDFKDSPIDKGPEVFMQLFNERIYIK